MGFDVAMTALPMNMNGSRPSEGTAPNRGNLSEAVVGLQCLTGDLLRIFGLPLRVVGVAF